MTDYSGLEIEDTSGNKKFLEAFKMNKDRVKSTFMYRLKARGEDNLYSFLENPGIISQKEGYEEYIDAFQAGAALTYILMEEAYGKELPEISENTISDLEKKLTPEKSMDAINDINVWMISQHPVLGQYLSIFSDSYDDKSKRKISKLGSLLTYEPVLREIEYSQGIDRDKDKDIKRLVSTGYDDLGMDINFSRFLPESLN